MIERNRESQIRSARPCGRILSVNLSSPMSLQRQGGRGLEAAGGDASSSTSRLTRPPRWARASPQSTACPPRSAWSPTTAVLRGDAQRRRRHGLRVPLLRLVRDALIAGEGGAHVAAALHRDRPHLRRQPGKDRVRSQRTRPRSTACSHAMSDRHDPIIP